jgi:hypothetical protein
MRVLSNTTMRRVLTIGVVFAAIATLSGRANGNADLLDVVSRIDYGFYTGDAKVITAATSELERLRGDDAARSYYRAYAVWRANQTDVDTSSRTRRDRTADCIDHSTELFDDPEWAIEAQVLAAACALWAEQAGGARSSLYRAKASEAIDAARALDPDNPRLLLIAAMAIGNDGSPEHGESRIAALAAALDRFDTQALTADFRPAWGRPETLARMGAIELERGNTREARDLIERALLEAPGYRFALQLQNALSLR